MEVFEGNKLLVWLVIAVLNVVSIVGIIHFGASFFFYFIILFISAITLVTVYTNKIMIVEPMLQYKRLGKMDEVDLMQVAAIYIREVETYVHKNRDDSSASASRIGNSSFQIGQKEAELERRVDKIIYVVDGEGRAFFSFPQSLIPHKQRGRFRTAIHKVNPDVEVF